MVEARPSASRRVEVNPFHSREEVVEKLISEVEAGGCACWVRNTVHDAVEEYRYFVQELGTDRVMLFHARFTLGDRLGIENKVLGLFGPESADKGRSGRLVIATQVVEQSLDLDFDYMVTDLAPVDLIIQRAGRLQRHERGRRTPVLGLFTPEPSDGAGRDWYSSLFPGASRVYRHHVFPTGVGMNRVPFLFIVMMNPNL